MANKFKWQPGNTQNVGSHPNRSPAGAVSITDTSQVIVGVGVSLSRKEFHASFKTAMIQSDGTLGSVETPDDFFTQDHSASVDVAKNNEVVVGLALAVSGSKLTGIKLYARRLNPTTGSLDPIVSTCASSNDSNKKYSLQWWGEDYSQTLLTGLAGDVNAKGKLTTLALSIGNVIPFYQNAQTVTRFTLSYDVATAMLYYGWTDSAMNAHRSAVCPVLVGKPATPITFTCDTGLTFQSSPAIATPPLADEDYTCTLTDDDTVCVITQLRSSSAAYQLQLRLMYEGTALPLMDPIVLNPSVDWPSG